MLESLVQWDEGIEAGADQRETIFTVSPGVRAGWNAGDSQLVVGVGIPTTFSDETTDVGVFGYFSYELPFRR
jgi:hypothetical protein